MCVQGNMLDKKGRVGGRNVFFFCFYVGLYHDYEIYLDFALQFINPVCLFD